jgi:hypothetical protein
LPRPDHVRIIHADRLILLYDLSAAVGGLAFQRVAGQCFGTGSLPHKSPKLSLALGSFARLNPSRHALQLIPRPRRRAISILSQKVGAIKQKADVGAIRVIGMALPYRATAALIKGVTMGLFGTWVIGATVWHAARKCRTCNHWPV